MTRRAGFTLIELLVVIAVIAVLAAIALATLLSLRSRARISATRGTVQAVATAIQNYAVQRTWTVVDPVTGATRDEALFDLNRDGYLDGDPGTGGEPPAVRARRDLGDAPTARVGGAAQSRPFTAAQIASGYTGFARMAQPALGRSALDAHGRVLDAWGWPLRIAYATDVYGTGGFGVWSDGPDGVAGTADDIASWDSGQR